MSIGWLAILQNVPWADVIKNAPKVAEGAKKLWNNLSGSTPLAPLSQAGGTARQSTAVPTLDTLHTRLGKTELAVDVLHRQMLESSKLIEALAKQNTLLIARVEANRVRLRWLTALTLVLAVVAVTALTLALRATHT